MKVLALLLLSATAAFGQAKDTVYRLISDTDLGPSLQPGVYVVDTPQLRLMELMPGYRYTITQEVANLVIASTSFTDSYGVEANGQVVGSIDKNDWLKYFIIIPRPARAIILRYAMADNVFGGIEFRLNSETGTIIGQSVLKPTGSWGTFFDVEIPVNIPAAGSYILYLTFKNSARDNGAGGNQVRFEVKH